MTRLCIRSSRWLATALLAVTAMGCSDGGIGEGNRLERIFIDSLAGTGVTDPLVTVRETAAGTREGDAHRCLQSSLVAIGVFTDGTRENLTSRANWSSSAPNLIRISNGDEPASEEGTFFARGVLTPVGAPGSRATITARFLSLSASVDLGILPSRIEISPATRELAAGSLLQLNALAILNERRILNAGTIVTWQAQNGGAARASVDEFGLLKTEAGGAQAADVVTVTALPAATGCSDFAAQRALRINNNRFTALDIRTEFNGNNPAPLVLPASSQEGLRVVGVVADGEGNVSYSQDLTETLIRRQVTANLENTTRPLTSSDPDNPSGSPIAAFLPLDTIVALASALPAGVNEDIARMRVVYEQTGGAVEKSFDLVSRNLGLNRLRVEPASQNVVGGSFAALQVKGQFADNTERDLTRSVSATATPAELAAVVSNAGQLLVVTGTDGQGVATVNAQRSDPVTGIISAADSGGAASLSVGTAPVTSLRVGKPGSTESSVTLGVGELVQLQALGDNGQDLTRSVVWTSNRPEGVRIDNFSTRSGQITGVAADTNPVTVTARLFLQKTDGTVTDVSGSTQVTVGAGGSGGSGGAGGSGGSGGGGLCLPPLITTGC